jgi:hypothetical protein
MNWKGCRWNCVGKYAERLSKTAGSLRQNSIRLLDQDLDAKSPKYEVEWNPLRSILMSEYVKTDPLH